MRAVIGLAPMAGFTDYPLRVLCYRYGADYAATEMVSAMGLTHAKPSNPAYQRLLATDPREFNTACQLFGRDPQVMGEAAACLSEMGCFAQIDLNMGCPARKVTGSGDGSALLREPDRAARIMESVKLASRLPVSVKTRLGYDASSMNALILAQAAEQYGLDHIAIHGRTREQQYAGTADRDAVARIKARVRIPVWYNGDVSSPADAVAALKQTGCDGVLIGRAALGDPFLFEGVRAALDGRAPRPVPARERIDTALEQARMMAALKGEPLALLQMRKHAAHYLRGVRGASAVRRELNQTQTLQDLERLLYSLLPIPEGGTMDENL